MASSGVSKMINCPQHPMFMYLGLSPSGGVNANNSLILESAGWAATFSGSVAANTTGRQTFHLTQSLEWFQYRASTVTTTAMLMVSRKTETGVRSLFTVARYVFIVNIRSCNRQQTCSGRSRLQDTPQRPQRRCKFGWAQFPDTIGTYR